MTISNAVISAHVFSEKFIYARNVKAEITLHEEIKKIWSIDKETIINGYRNGPAATQHGVNAEYQHIAEFNINEIQQAASENREALLMEKSPEVNGPTDMIRGDQLFQAKYYNNTKGSLDGCIKHLEKYEEIYGAGTESFYVIPPEQYADLLAIKQAQTPEGYTDRQARNLQIQIEKFEAEKGDIENFIQPGAVTYEDAQLENLEATISQTEEKIANRHEKAKAANEKAASASATKMFQQAAISAFVAGMFSVYNRVRKDRAEGKDVFAGEYEKEDFIGLAKEFAETGLLAGLSTSILYGLSVVFTKSATPAIMSYRIAKDMFALSMRYNAKKISLDELYERAYVNTSIIVLNTMGNSCVNILLGLAFSSLQGTVFIPALLVYLIPMAASIAMSYLVLMMVEYIKTHFGEKIKEGISVFVSFFNNFAKLEKAVVKEEKEEVITSQEVNTSKEESKTSLKDSIKGSIKGNSTALYSRLKSFKSSASFKIIEASAA